MFEDKYEPLIVQKEWAKVREAFAAEESDSMHRKRIKLSIIGTLWRYYMKNLDGLHELRDIAAECFGYILVHLQWYMAAIYLLAERLVDVNGVYVIELEDETIPYIATKALYDVEPNDNQQKTKILEMLLEQGANPNVYESESQVTPVMMAITQSNVVALELLLRHGASLTYSTSHGTPLRLMASYLWRYKGKERRGENLRVNDRKMKRLLMSLIEGVIKVTSAQDLNTVNRNQKETPLHYIAMTDYYKIARMMLDAGADPYVKADKYKSIWRDKTSIDCAREARQERMAKMLEDYVKEKEAKKVFTVLNEMKSPEHMTIPYDVALTIAQKTAKMDEDQFHKFAKKTLADIRRGTKKTKTRS